MVARLLRVLVFGLIAAALAWWFASSALGLDLPWRMLGLIAVAAPHALPLACEFCALLLGSGAAMVPAPSIRQLTIAWGQEVLIGWAVFAWRQPFTSNREPDQLDARRHRGRRGVILVHGFLCNRGLWSPWMRALKLEDCPFVAVDLEPVFGSIDDYAQTIEDAVARVERVTGVPPLVVAHSMGGLAVRAWLRRFDADRRIDAVLTIGTPHQGTRLARFAASRNGRQMRRCSRWLRALAAVETTGRVSRFICYYGHCDNVVQPCLSSTLPQADNRHLAGVGHLAMVNHPEVIAAVFARLRASVG